MHFEYRLNQDIALLSKFGKSSISSKYIVYIYIYIYIYI